MMSESYAITSRSNKLVDSARGSIYLFKTTLILNGINLFMNNTVQYGRFNDYVAAYTHIVCNYSIIKDSKMHWTIGMVVQSYIVTVPL